MKPILITGATGNVGRALLQKISTRNTPVYAGVRNIAKAKTQIKYRNITLCLLDFEKGIYPDIEFSAIFLIRPPHLANPDIFRSFLQTISHETKIVFLSVSGADRKGYLPHAKIEKLILSMKFPHVFIRPGYFMENLLTTLWNELETNKRIYLPAANVKFNWVAIQDIVEIAHYSLINEVKSESIEVLNSNYQSFGEVIREINKICNTRLVYQSPSLIQYILYMIKKGEKITYILIMLLLHYIPRIRYEKPFFPMTLPS